MTDDELIGAAEVTDDKDAITVWVGTEEIKAQIVRNLSAKSFTPKSGIATAVKNVDAGSLMSAVVVGMGPDVVARQAPTFLTTRCARRHIRFPALRTLTA